MKLQGKIALITGASSGLGALLAQQLSARGATVALTARSAGKLEQVAAGLNGPAVVYPMDVQQTEQVRLTVEQIIERFGRIDLLINNAGYGRFETFLNMSQEQFADMMDVNYMGIVRCTQAVLPHMLRNGSGHIVNIASMAGKIGSAKSTAYAASKHAVLGLTNSLRQELSGTGIAVTAINPGPIKTPFFEIADPEGNYVKKVEWFMLNPDKVARAIVRAIESGRIEKDMPWSASLGVKLVQLFPGLFDRIAAKVLNNK
ncbi:SDR family oxidoreductase [Paenibacillus athensensis]|uniref:Oxidoreductase n=1 Tax=Paenibacillus athensensis TaxID=1967502 RepID=A0A4Y8Q753_9BACL|nr:SDR family oxidoreductase [Paenibacillus athensensis]MCD1259719.1 SDR family oxidoreductase [Paenibacillus athensensis]